MASFRLTAKDIAFLEDLKVGIPEEAAADPDEDRAQLEASVALWRAEARDAQRRFLAASFRPRGAPGWLVALVGLVGLALGYLLGGL